jgi:hypothetical protein
VLQLIAAAADAEFSANLQLLGVMFDVVAPTDDDSANLGELKPPVEPPGAELLANCCNCWLNFGVGCGVLGAVA